MDQHLKKTFTRAGHPKANSTLEPSLLCCGNELIGSGVSRLDLRDPVLIVKQSLSGGCPTIDVCYHTDINGKQKYKTVIITITIIIWSTTDPAVSV